MNFVAIDVETANANRESICQIGLATYENGALVSEWASLVNPDDYFDEFNVSIHGITEASVKDAPKLTEIVSVVTQTMRDRIVVSHSPFDRTAINRSFSKYSLTLPTCTWLDTVQIARKAWKGRKTGYRLKDLCADLAYEFKHHHALEDAKACAYVLLAAIDLTGIGVEGWLETANASRPSHKDFPQDGNPEGQLFGEVLVFTGSLSISRSEAAEMAAKMGCRVSVEPSKKTTILVVGDQYSSEKKNNKHIKVEEFIEKGCSIRILVESDFKELVRFC